MAGTGKRTALSDALRALATARGLPFSIQLRPLVTGSGGVGPGDVTAAGASEEGAGPEATEAGQFLYEASLVHIGLDIARMSMQDKHILRPILTKLGSGSQVLAGEQGHGARILVLYHAHLLSSESVLLLQACLEQNEGDLSIWMTSELPVPQRIRDWFVELPVAGDDHTFEEYKRVTPAEEGKEHLANWPDIFRDLLKRWLRSPPPRLQEVREIKAIVYEMLMRNLRWVEVVHFLLDVVLTMDELTKEQRMKAIGALAACEATGGGYTIPSYRIPILWESLFLQLRTILCSPVPSEKAVASQHDEPAPPGPKKVTRGRKKAVGSSPKAVA